MKYPRISELGVSIKKVTPAHGGKPYLDFVEIDKSLNRLLADLGIISDVYGLIDWQIIHSGFIPAAKLEAALERCISGRVVEV